MATCVHRNCVLVYGGGLCHKGVEDANTVGGKLARREIQSCFGESAGQLENRAASCKVTLSFVRGHGHADSCRLLQPEPRSPRRCGTMPLLAARKERVLLLILASVSCFP